MVFDLTDFQKKLLYFTNKKNKNEKDYYFTYI